MIHCCFSQVSFIQSINELEHIYETRGINEIRTEFFKLYTDCITIIKKFD